MADRVTSAAQGRRIGVDACWCSEDDTEPKYGHADDHILARRCASSTRRQRFLCRLFGHDWPTQELGGVFHGRCRCCGKLSD